MTSILKIENLTRVYRSGDEELPVFQDLNFEIQPGELVALLGESGSGKSTLLHLLAALDTPTRGEVYFKGERVSRFSAKERAAYRNAHVGFVWQMHYLLPEFSALENVVLPQVVGGRDFKESAARGRKLLTEVGLAKALGRRVGELSGGEQQRVALARALANQPALLLADEPTGNLDYGTAERVMSMLEGLHKAHGLTSVVATHNLQLVRNASRWVRLAEGKLTEVAVPDIR